MLEWTGERYLPFVNPKVCGAEIHYEHLHRYSFASQLADGKRVLDLASGEGYGSYMLSKVAKRVVGVDIDEESVNHASAKYISKNIEFLKGSITEVPIKGEKIFDLIVCFEALEHIAEHDALFSEIKRLLKEDGVLIISTPNKQVYTDDHDYENPFHVKELYFDDFKQLLNYYFADVGLFGQRIYSASFMWDLYADNQNLNEFIIKKGDNEFYFTDKNSKETLYFVAIASNNISKFNQVHSTYLLDTSDSLFNNYKNTINSLSALANEKDDEIKTLNEYIHEKDDKIKTFNEYIHEKDDEIKTLKEYIHKKNDEIRNLKENLSEKDVEIKTLNETLNENYLRMSNLEKEINLLKYSVLWRLSNKYHLSFVERFLPPTTQRRSYYDLCLDGMRILVAEGPQNLLYKYKERKRFKEYEKSLLLQESGSTHINQKLEDWIGEKLVFPKVEDETCVSIIIPVFNKHKYTFNCLKSILNNTKSSFEVVVVDDCSTDETQDLLDTSKNITVLRNEVNQGFVESCNRGANVSKGKYILFLNNDTIVIENWLQPLVETISKPEVGAVGAKLVYPTGQLQEAGGIIWSDASGWNYGRMDNPKKPEYNFVREVDYCSGAALLVKKELFEKLGGFDDRFKPGYYEDTDICFGIRKMGYKVIYQPESVITHFEGITSGTDLSSGMKKYQVINKDKFAEKWKDVLKQNHLPNNPENVFSARNRAQGKSILVIDHYVPNYDKDSGSLRMFNILKILAELGHRVTFIGDNLARIEPYTTTLQGMGIEVIYGDYHKSIHDFLDINGTYFDVVILSRPHIADKHIHYIKKYCPNSKIVFDTVDLHFLRTLRRYEVEKDNQILRESENTKNTEMGLTRMCDSTWVVSPVEQKILLKEEPSLQVDVVSNIHEIHSCKKKFSERKDIMFIGGFVHRPNIDAVKWFVNDIFPLVKAKVPGIKFYVVGDKPTKEIQKLASDDIIVTGFVEDVSPYFENCRVFVAPLRYGAGVKGKINQSMSYGLPVVTTTIGAEGMGLIEGENALIADDPEDFCNKIEELYENEKSWNKISSGSIENVQEMFSYDVWKENIKQIINRIDDDNVLLK